MYNSETKEVMGRTGSSWAKVLTFYLAFYSIFAGFWAICMVCFIKTLDPKVPTMLKMYSMMKDNPGMSFEPFFDGNQTTLIYFNPDIEETYKQFVTELQTFVETWANHTANSMSLLNPNCTADRGATPEKACMFNVSFLDDTPCNLTNKFGYREGKPCVLLRINRVFDWNPIPVTLDKFPCTDPSDKSNHNCARTLEFKNMSRNIRTDIYADHIGVSCQGENDADADNIIKVTFYPKSGFPAYFFPFLNQDNYTSPFVMAQFEVEMGRVSMIQCKVWTRDIVHDLNDRQGSLHFELMISNSTSSNY